MKQKGASDLDKAIWTIYEEFPHINWYKPYKHTRRYLMYYAEEGLYMVFDTWCDGLYFMEADSPREAVHKVHNNKLAYLPKGEA